MLTPVGRAGAGIVTPMLKSGDSSFGVANWNSLDNALRSSGSFNGTVQLPAGPIYLESASYSAINLDESRAFLTVRGSGRDKTLLIPTGTTVLASLTFASGLVGSTKDGSFTVGGNIITVSNPVNFAKYEEGDVVYFWKRPTSPTNTRSVRQRIVLLPPTAPDTVNLASTIAGSPDPDDFQHIKGHAVDGTTTAHSAVPIGATSVVMLDDSFASQFVIGDDVLIGDGPGINEFRGEWVRVTGTASAGSGKTTISFNPPLQQTYDVDKTCIVPGRLNPLTGRRQHLTDILIRDLSICAPTSGTYAGQFGVVRAGVRIRFENVGFIKSPFESSAQTLNQIAFATCGDVTIRDASTTGKSCSAPFRIASWTTSWPAARWLMNSASAAASRV